MTFFEQLERRARALDTALCVGIDPHPEDLPTRSADAALSFGRRLVDACADHAAAFKPNAAFFEALGPAGLEALARLIAHIGDTAPVILDVKRGDIASTAESHAEAAFTVLGAGAVTLNPYLGEDAVLPFLEYPGRGIFVLCRTSNPSAGQLQGLTVLSPSGSRPLFEEVAAAACRWGPAERLGLVAGATHPGDLARVRAAAPQHWILAPGIGAQGGDLQTCVAAGLRADGLGLLVTASRSISRASDPGDAARRLRDDLRASREQAAAPPRGRTDAIPPDLGPLADGLLDSGCVRFGRFTLKSGLLSPIYLDLRRLIADPALLALAASAYLPVLQGLSYDLLAPLPYAALPIGTALSLMSGRPMIYPRKEVKGYGTRAAVEGVFSAGQRAVIIDDLATTGGSKLEALERLEAAELSAADIVVLIDRQSGARESLAQRGLRLHAVFTLEQLLERWSATGRITAAQHGEVDAFLRGEGPA